MTSILEVEQLDTLSSNASSTLTIGGTNTTTIAFGPNVTTTPSSLAVTPAFHVRLNADQSFSSVTNTKIEFDTEVYDTDNCYDNTTNYRFTPTTAGKYFVYTVAKFTYSASTNNNLNLKLRKNGSDYARANYVEYTNDSNPVISLNVSTIVDMNGSTDYLEVFGYADSDSPIFDGGGADVDQTYFGAYRMIGL